MKYPLKPLLMCTAVSALIAMTSCKKENSQTTAEEAAITSAASQTQAIAVAASAATPGDSIYVVHSCAPGSKRDTIAFGDLPATVKEYLNTSYAGYAPQKAYTVTDASGTLQGYVVIIQFNGNPVGLKFDATGAFVQVLEQREGHDLIGRGWHTGGRFQNRDGRQRDTISLTALPEQINAYFSGGYAGDTLIRAFQISGNGYLVLSKNNGLFATVFDASASFVGRVELPSQKGKAVLVDQDLLPANALSYLSSTYPGYVFNKAFSVTINGIVEGYCVVIESNNTRYGIQFDAAGNFIIAKAIR